MIDGTVSSGDNLSSLLELEGYGGGWLAIPDGPFVSHDQLSSRLAISSNVQVVAVDGPTSSGKTQFTTSLIARLRQQDVAVAHLPLDHFLTSRTVRNGIFEDVVGGRLDISKYSIEAWDHARFGQVIRYFSNIVRGVLPAENVTIDNVYNRSTGERDSSESIKVYPGGVVVAEGVGLHALHSPSFNIRIRLDVQDEAILEDRVVQREKEKEPHRQLTEDYLRRRFQAIDAAHTRYLRLTSAVHADYAVDTSDFSAMLLCRRNR